MKMGTVTLSLESYDAMMEELNAYRSSVVIETYSYEGEKIRPHTKFTMNKFCMRQVKKQFDELGLESSYKIAETASTHTEGLYGIISEKKEE